MLSGGFLFEHRTEQTMSQSASIEVKPMTDKAKKQEIQKQLDQEFERLWSKAGAHVKQAERHLGLALKELFQAEQVLTSGDIDKIESEAVLDVRQMTNKVIKTHGSVLWIHD